jgi:hypothetical protein
MLDIDTRTFDSLFVERAFFRLKDEFKRFETSRERERAQRPTFQEFEAALDVLRRAFVKRQDFCRRRFPSSAMSRLRHKLARATHKKVGLMEDEQVLRGVVEAVRYGHLVFRPTDGDLASEIAQRRAVLAVLRAGPPSTGTVTPLSARGKARTTTPSQFHSTPQTSAAAVENNFTEKDAREGLEYIHRTYGREMAEIIERIYRIETTHFTSRQYARCGTAGMEAFSTPPHYGWDASLFSELPTGTWKAFEGVGLSESGGNKQIKNRKKSFVVFPSVQSAMDFQAKHITKHDGNYARWHARDAAPQQEYREKLRSIRPKIVRSFTEK